MILVNVLQMDVMGLNDIAAGMCYCGGGTDVFSTKVEGDTPFIRSHANSFLQ